MASTNSRTPSPPVQTRWSSRWQLLAQSRLWFFLLSAIGTFSSVIYPHPPLVAFGAIAGGTLKPQRAILTAMTIWFTNQIYGFGLRGYPHTTESFAWAMAMGLGSLLVTLLASVRPDFSRVNLKGHCLWMLMSAIVGFIVFESLILSFGWLLTGDHPLSWAIMGRLFLKEFAWSVALVTGHLLLVRRSV